MTQDASPILEALKKVLDDPPIGFGGPGHNMGRGAGGDVVALVGNQAFRADVLTPKGLDDRTESAGVMQEAYRLAAEAWNGASCRFSTGGSTQGVQTALAVFAAPGDTVLVAGNAHKAEFLTAVYAGLDVRTLPVEQDADRDLEHGVTPDALEAALASVEACRAVLVVSPTFYGVTSDIRALSAVCRRRGVPLIVDAAWGGAFPFCSRLPQDALGQGADIAVSSVHKTMGGLAQSAIIVASERVDPQRFALACDMLQTTSPSVPLLASIDALRRRHVRDGEHLWSEVLARADRVRAAAGEVPGLVARGRELLGTPGAADIDLTKVLIDVSQLGATGFQVDAWLATQRRISVVLSDRRHIMAVFSIGSTDEDADRLIEALRALPAAVADHPAWFHPADPSAPRVADLKRTMSMSASRAFYGKCEVVAFERAQGRVAAEIVAPMPPEVPRLIPGQYIDGDHVAFLLAQRAAGAFIPDPAGHGEGYIRVVADQAPASG